MMMTVRFEQTQLDDQTKPSERLLPEKCVTTLIFNFNNTFEKIKTLTTTMRRTAFENADAIALLEGV